MSGNKNDFGAKLINNELSITEAQKQEAIKKEEHFYESSFRSLSSDFWLDELSWLDADVSVLDLTWAVEDSLFPSYLQILWILHPL